jgi:hypothetical protein
MTALNSHRVWRGVALCAASFLLAACGAAGLREGDVYLPVVNQIDSGSIVMKEGEFLVSLNAALLGDAEGDTLILSDPATGAKLELPDATTVGTAEQVYEMDGKAGIDYLVITLRRLGSMEGLVTHGVKDNAEVGFSDFFKVGGITVQPVDASLSQSITLTVPINSTNQDTSLELYKWIPSAQATLSAGGGKSASGIETVTGNWVFVSSTVTVNTDGTATFSVGSFGQYAVVSDIVPGTAPV